MNLPQLLVAALVALPLQAAAGAADDSTKTTSGPQQPAALNPKPWYRPRHVVLQTGGGLGMVAAGAGYAFWRNTTEVDVLLGYVPQKYAGSALSLASAKLLYSPWTIPVGQKWAIKPLTAGLYFSYTHGTINDEERGQYTKDYYWFSTDTRLGPLLGSRLSYALASTDDGRPRSLSAYYELGSNDLYLISYVQNRRGLSLPDILVLSLGVKLDF